MTGSNFVARHLLQRSFVSLILYPFSLLFSLILILRRFLYKAILLQYKAPVCVISIGNIIAGGSGKTPFTIYLALLLQQEGFTCAVSHRGYRSKLEHETALVSDREKLLPLSDSAGDEAWLLAKRLPGIPVVVGKNRIEAVMLLCERFPDLDYVILDDSFQNLKMHHDLDIVIVNEKLGFGNGYVLPAGYLREPFSALQNADLLILNRQNIDTEIRPELAKQLDITGRDILTGSYFPERFYDFDGQEISIEDVKQGRAILASGIGNPESFKEAVSSCGIRVSGEIVFPDHYSFEDESGRGKILSLAREKTVRWIIVTEKDYAKLRFYHEFRDLLLVFRICFRLEQETETLMNYIKALRKKSVTID